eukprot:TRINITY_DN5398_c0_g1_i1.p1 TRINITY_DN5398_c0_g1~~TRINITY_DN5398_c0_g1_i1.p1  ORF type:complete len:273 (-),score=72.44 TRINITY_DN5398_c0_g1_i1:67-885(-)
MSFIGPALPPHLQKKPEEEKEKEQKTEQPKKRIIGPQRPPENDSEETPKESNEPQKEEAKVEVPAKRTVSVGPVIGPRPPPPGQNDSDSDEDDPLLNARPKSYEIANSKGASGASGPKREDWMTSLPEARTSASLLVTRQFSKTGNYSLDRGDTSGWTDTPSEAASKASSAPPSKPKISGVDEKHNFAERDKKMEAIAKKHDKDRGESLFEQHQKGSKRKPESNEEPEEYKSFNRETDLDVRRADPTRVKKLVQESHQLNDRFSSGSSKKYL